MKRSLILFNFLFFIISNSIGATYSGTCGDPNTNSGKNVNWTLNNGTLTISGSGAMLNYTGGASSSSEIFGWSDYRYEITSVVISSGVTNVGASAFVNCSSLSSVTLASTVTKIGDDAFNGCKQLKEITLPSSCSSIGERAFQNTRISSITFPSSLTSIGAFAFMNSSLETVTCKASTPPTLGSLPFGYWDVTTLWVNDVNAYKASDWNDYFSKIVKIGTSGEATIGGSCGTNVKWSYADGVLTISGTGAMDDFYHSYGYDSRPWSTYVDDITSIIIEEGVTYIGKEAFRFCDNYDLTSIILPSTITAIGDYAFYYCDNLDVIKCEATTPPTFGSGTFESVYVTLYVHDKAVYKDSSWGMYYNFNIKQIGLMEYTLQLKYDYAQGIATGSGTYDEGQEVTIEADPRYSYKFVKWSDGNTDNPRTLTINKDLTLTAEFAIEEYEVVIESEGNGHVTGSGTYEHGSEVTITATPDEHYHFCGWSDGSTDNPRTLTIIQDKTLTAEFCINRYSVKFESDPNQGYAYGLGEDYLWGSTSVDAGEQITIQAYPKNGYTFVNWSDGNTENPRTLTITQDTVLKPEFAISKYQLTIESAGNGSVTGSGTFEYGSEVTITATPDEHHHFVAWSDGSTDNPRNIIVTENTTISATFAIDEHQLTIESAGNGSITGSGTYEYGSEVTITATPDEHYHFVAWSDGSTDNPRNIIVTENTTISATFAIDEHQLTIESAGNGSVTGSGTFEYGSEATITATPDEHHHFVAWSDGSTDNPRNIIVTENTTISATFAIDEHQLTIESAGNGSVTGSGTYEYGSEVTITATPDEHYHFVTWSDGSTDNPRNIIIQQDMVLTAQFALENTSVDKVTDCNVLIYVKGHILYIEGVDEEYNIFDTSGRLIYSGCDPQISLPQGLYLVKVGNTLKRVIL